MGGVSKLKVTHDMRNVIVYDNEYNNSGGELRGNIQGHLRLFQLKNRKLCSKH